MSLTTGPVLGAPHRLNTPWGPLHYREHGPKEGLPVVFLHGILVNGRLWDQALPELDSGLRCLVPDWPLGAHPEAMAADAPLHVDGVVALIDHFLDALDLEQVVLVGSDSGGALTQLYAVRHPERVRALVLAPSDADGTWLPGIFKPLEWAAFVPGVLWLVSQLMRWPAFRRLPLAFGWLSRHLDPERSDAFVLPWSRSFGLRRDLGKFLRDLGPRHTRAAALLLPGIAVPTRILWATEDPLFPPELGRWLAATIPGAQLQWVEDSYALVPLDQPVVLARAINEHLRSAGLLPHRSLVGVIASEVELASN